MNKLVEIVIWWSMHKVGFHTDIKNMYNSVKLVEDDWCLQQYIWQKDLDPRKLLKEKVIKTLIYGVKSSLRETARLSAEEYPQINQIVQNDICIDDCLSGDKNFEKALQSADELELVLNHGGFTLKGITFTEGDRPSALSTDDSSVNVAGMKWFPKEDLLALHIGELNFAKKQCGKTLYNTKTSYHPNRQDKIVFQKWLKSLT